MNKLIVFNNVTLDGYFTDRNGDMSWAHRDSNDVEWNEFVTGNASSESPLLFGRITYEMMAGYWPTPMAAKNNPVVADHINRSPKFVFSRTLDTASWSNTTVVKGDLLEAVRKLKRESPVGAAILGSGSIVSQLARENLIDEYQVVVNPIALGAGRTMFDGIGKKLPLRLTKSRTFRNGNVLVCYEPEV